MAKIVLRMIYANTKMLKYVKIKMSVKKIKGRLEYTFGFKF